MIVIYGSVDQNNTTLIQQLKKYFETKIVIPNWNGVDRVEDKETTLVITKVKPPYLQPFKALSLEGAMRIMQA